MKKNIRQSRQRLRQGRRSGRGLTVELPPLFASSRKAHGRTDHHDITLRPVDPLDVNFPHVETVIRIRRDSTAADSDTALEMVMREF